MSGMRPNKPATNGATDATTNAAASSDLISGLRCLARGSVCLSRSYSLCLLSLFTGVLGREILRTSRDGVLRSSPYTSNSQATSKITHLGDTHWVLRD